MVRCNCGFSICMLPSISLAHFNYFFFLSCNGKSLQIPSNGRRKQECRRGAGPRSKHLEVVGNTTSEKGRAGKARWRSICQAWQTQARASIQKQNIKNLQMHGAARSAASLPPPQLFSLFFLFLRKKLWREKIHIFTPPY